MSFKRLKTFSACLVFGISLFIYLRTLEPTVSFWDCGEFLSCASKLEVGHQPGAPFFLILGRIFSLLTTNPSKTAIMINALSAVSSAFTILFLFLTITMLTGKLLKHATGNSASNQIIILACGFIGSLACAFSDTFWFSAVEAEVYATSSLFTALVFWAMLKWDEETDLNPVRANRWLLFIVYLMGLSIGVHLLNLLTIPALVMIYYFKEHDFTKKGLIKSALIGFALLGFVVFGFIPWSIKIVAWFDLFFVNVIGLPVNSGALIFLSGLAFTIIMLLITYRKRNQLNRYHIVMAITVFIIGYSSYTLVLIRADAGPVVNMNKADNPYSLMQYINREQYVSRPLIYGPYYNAEVKEYRDCHTWVPINGRYQKTPVNPKCIYDKKDMTLFPRMSGNEPQDIAGYKRWTGSGDGKPGFGKNLYYFFRYQVGYMYIRYFMWNFAGRQNENQGTGNVMNGNWISGIPMIDEWRLGSDHYYPEALKINKGRNRYYLLPLILGILGVFFQMKRNKKDFTVVLSFFILTGIAVVIYLNEIPQTPRERDYAVGGSFYVFCIWIGLGVYAIYESLNKWFPRYAASSVAILVSISAAPAIMLKENYDDHNRSNRYVARDIAWNYLNSCAPNAILFTNADNDTYPLWYLQEVEGVRTDVRVILAPYLNADWYIEKLSSWQNNAAPVKQSIEMSTYLSGKLNYIPCYKRTENPLNTTEVIEFIKSNDPRAMLELGDHSLINYYPGNRLMLPGKNGSNPLIFNLNDKMLYKNQIVILDMLACNNWERPVYFISTQVPDELGLSDYLQLDGFAYRLIPVKNDINNSLNTGYIDTNLLYEKLMHVFKWGNIQDSTIFVNSDCVRNMNVMAVRNTFARLAEELIKEGKSTKALSVLDRCMKVMPNHAVPYDIYMLRIIMAYYNAGEPYKAKSLAHEYEDIIAEERKYFESLPRSRAQSLQYEISYNQYVTEQLRSIMSKIEQ